MRIPLCKGCGEGWGLGSPIKASVDGTGVPPRWTGAEGAAGRDSMGRWWGDGDGDGGALDPRASSFRNESLRS